MVGAGASVVGAPEDAAADDRINADRSNGGIDAPAVDIGASVVGAPASVDHLNILVGGIGVSSVDPIDDDDRRHADMLVGASVAVGASAFAPV